MNASSAMIVAVGLVAAASVVTFGPVISWQAKGEQLEKRLEQAERLQAQTAKQLEQSDKALKEMQEKLLPLKNAPAKFRFLHEKKADKNASGHTIYGYAIYEEIATGDLYMLDDNFTKFTKVHDAKKPKKD